MLDLFGEKIVGHDLLMKTPFTDDEADEILSDALESGLLIDDIRENLEKLRAKRGQGTKITEYHKLAWSDLIWVYDLGDEAYPIPFDVACAITGSDSDNMRALYSVRYGNEIRDMYHYMSSRMPEYAARIKHRLTRWVDLEKVH